MAATIVIGVGSRSQGDDAVGLEVARRLGGRVPAEIAVVEQDGDGGGIFEALAGAGAAVIVDAALSGAPPGSINRWDAAARPLPAGMLRVSTHAFGLAEAVELARALGSLPARCTVLAVEAGRFGIGEAMSPAVAAAIEPAVQAVLAELALIREPADA
ncbi:MAG TPA: hydrogenase maturation protease [Bauldia sp.]|nr:hydrogenase maturation protease [Bauldia sp.]